MKKSAEIAGLPIISINDGVQIGSVESLVLNPEKGTIEFLTIQHEEWEENIKAIPFKKVVGIGEFALTIENANAVIDLTEVPVVNQLVTKNIQINNTRVMTRKGQLLGEAIEFFTDEEDGHVIGMILNVRGEEKLLPTEWVLTYGKDIIIVQEEAQDNFVEVAEKLDPAYATLAEDSQMEQTGEDLQTIREKQIELLSGKRVTKTIYSGRGEELFPEGTILESGDITRAQEEGPGVIVELSMNVEG
ncbi:PRC-barrel domain-containing protein [Peribacillus deserti]|uniref:Photosystem reaction center subunit H n=1 Tax=Peribacillus deserti TaxID=673318 RepID=A0A2N5M742_9BACI|nr:PRC-barrel domain-containing protein [Peribacillus deserti]PLT30155.1 photosystem reaction center subunit H [Peribacillus deserti]